MYTITILNGSAKITRRSVVDHGKDKMWTISTFSFSASYACSGQWEIKENTGGRCKDLVESERWATKVIKHEKHDRSLSDNLIKDVLNNLPFAEMMTFSRILGSRLQNLNKRPLSTLCSQSWKSYHEKKGKKQNTFGIVSCRKTSDVHIPKISAY